MEEKPNYYAIIPAYVRYDNDLKANEKLLFGEITALTQKDGKCWASNNYFAELYQVSTRSITEWLSNLQKRKYINVEFIYRENTKEIDKRVITIPIEENFYTYGKKLLGGYRRKLLGGIEENFQDNNTSINNTSINKKEIYKEKFEDIWKLYPNKKGKTNAYKSFTKAIKDGVSLDTIKQGVINYVNYIELENVKPQYIKHGSTWFNQRCWEDDYTIKRKLTTKDLKIDISDF
jgi:hypothetical protein